MRARCRGAVALFAAVGLAALLGSACGPRRPSKDPLDAPPSAADAGTEAVLPPIHVRASRDGERLTVDAYDADELFHRATVALRAGRCDRAIELYRRLEEEFSGSDLLEPALYNAGLCHDQLDQHREAAASYRALVDRFPGSRDVTDALFRLAGSLEALEAWDEVIAVLDRLLAERDDLQGVERVEALARKGDALMQIEDVQGARLALGEAVRLYRRGRGITPSDPVFHYSMAQFKLGEIVHRKMRAVELPPDEERLWELLEKKAELLLEAQRLYTKVIRIGHPHWAAAAAYRIGSLYHHLWVDILTADPPADLDEEAREIYLDILRERVCVLLEKAVLQWERTLKLAIRLGLDNEWIERTTRDLDKIREILVIEAAGERPQVAPDAAPGGRPEDDADAP